MSTKIMIIEDDIQLNLVITEYFKLKNCDVVSLYDGMLAIESIDQNSSIDLYIIDINLPSYDGIEILKYIRKTNLDTPIIIITASLEIQNFIDAFDSGCNEYIKKPFHIKEIEVRANQLLNIQENTLCFYGDFHYNQCSKSLFYKNEEITLRHKEKLLIEILIQNINKTVPTEVIYDYVWEGEIKESYPIRQLLNGLRKKLPIDFITTFPKEGYIIKKQNEN